MAVEGTRCSQCCAPTGARCSMIGSKGRYLFAAFAFDSRAGAMVISLVFGKLFANHIVCDGQRFQVRFGRRPGRGLRQFDTPTTSIQSARVFKSQVGLLTGREKWPWSIGAIPLRLKDDTNTGLSEKPDKFHGSGCQSARTVAIRIDPKVWLRLGAKNDANSRLALWICG